MTRFERDVNWILEGNAVVVLTGRKQEIELLENAYNKCRNSFRKTCIAQEIERLSNEYRKLDMMV